MDQNKYTYLYQHHNLKHVFGLRWAIAYNWQKYKFLYLISLCPFYKKSFKIDRFSKDDVGAWNNKLIIIKNYFLSIFEKFHEYYWKCETILAKLSI